MAEPAGHRIFRSLPLALGLPLALWGVLNHIVPYQAMAVAVRGITAEFQKLLRLVPEPVLEKTAR